jgi:membrane peptidoglycan carboxypeptidase
MGKLIKAGSALIAVCILAAAGFFIYVYQAAGVDLARPKVEDSVILASDEQQVLGHIASSGNHHTELTAEQISPLLRQAFMAAEDRKFYQHGPVSFLDMAKRIALSGGKAGGSGIEQQYVKNQYTDGQRSVGRKVKEIPYAYALGKKYTKTQVLDMYINSNYYGFGAYGVEDACLAIFGHSATLLKDMSDPVQVAKASFLAAIINAPSYYGTAVEGKPNQLAHMDELVKRQNYVLDGFGQLEGRPKETSDQTMAQRVDPSVIAQARTKLPLQLKRTARSTGTSEDADPYLVSYIKEWLVAWQTQIAQQDEGLNDEQASRRGKDLAEAMLARGGLKIQVSIDANLQKATTDAVKANLKKRGITAGVIILNQGGGVVAMYGGDYSVNKQNNALYANRQPGSVMKPVLLADMISQGVSVQSKFAAPAYIDIDGPRIWNDDRKPAVNCELTLADAMAVSNNVVFTEAMANRMASCRTPQTLSPIEGLSNNPASTKAMASKLGGDDSTVPGKTSPSVYSDNVRLAIGDAPTALSPLKVASMGLTLANRGEHTKPHIIDKIETSSGTVAYQNETTTNRALSTEQADIENQVLAGVFTKGTASGAQVKNHPLAGKTGTTDRDAWIMAYNARDPKGKAPTYSCAAWMGYLSDNQGTTNGDLWGADAARICQGFFGSALNTQPRVDFAAANTSSGKLVGLSTQTTASPSTVPSTPSPKPSAAPSATRASKSSSPSPTKSSPSATASRTR